MDPNKEGKGDKDANMANPPEMTSGTGSAAGAGKDTAASGKGVGPTDKKKGPKTSTPAKKGGTGSSGRGARASSTRRNSTPGSSSTTATTDSLMKEQEALDKKDKEKRQSKLSEYLKRKKEEIKRRDKEEREAQDYRRNRSSSTPANPAVTGAAPATPTPVEAAAEAAVTTFQPNMKTMNLSARATEALQAARKASEVAKAATAMGAPAMASVALHMAETASQEAARLHKHAGEAATGTSWANEVDKEKEEQARRSVCVVQLGQDEAAAQRALKETKKEKRKPSLPHHSARYRTVSSSSSTARTGTGTEGDDDDFQPVARRKKGHKPRDPIQERVDKERRWAAEERRSGTSRIPRITVVLTEQQKWWYKRYKCLNCGEAHKVYHCKERGISKEKISALLRAARKEFPEGPSAKTTSTGAKGTESGSDTSKGTKRGRDAERTGITPEAKKGRPAAWTPKEAPMPTAKPWFKPVQQTEHTLFIKNKDGTPLSEERFNDIKSRYDKIRIRIGKANMAKAPENREFTPSCSGWNWSQEVSRITLKNEESFRWAKVVFGEYQLMNLQEWKASRGKLYCAYVTDRFDPSITGGMNTEDLTVAIWQARGDLGLEEQDLFQFVRAPKVARGRLIFISVGEKAEEALRQARFKLEIGSAGDVLFTDNERFQQYKRERREQEQEILRQQHAADEGEEEDEEDGEDTTLTQEKGQDEEEQADQGQDNSVVLIKEHKGEKEKHPQPGQQLQGQGAEAMEQDDLEGMRLFLQKAEREQEEREQQEKGRAEMMELDTDGLGPMLS